MSYAIKAYVQYSRRMIALDARSAKAFSAKDYERYLLSCPQFSEADIDKLRDFIARAGQLGQDIDWKFTSYYAHNPETRVARAQFDLVNTPRGGWVQRMSENAGNVLHHSRAMARFIEHYDDPDLPQDRSHMMALAEVHDMAEAIITDLTPKDKQKHNISKELKALLEAMAIAIIYEAPSLTREKELIEEYESKSSEAAKMVSDIDKCYAVLEAAHQKINPNVRRKQPLGEEIFESVTDGRLLKTPMGERLLAKIRQEFDALNAAQADASPSTPVIDLFLQSQQSPQIQR